MLRKKLLKKRSSSSLSVRSLGTGEIAPSPDCRNGTDQQTDESSFVVRNFRGLRSKWVHCEHDERNKNGNDPCSTGKPASSGAKSLSKQDTFVSSTTDSDREETEEETGHDYDTTTDLAYHNASEKEGAELVRRALTPEEESAMPDEFMPLRHYRAEKGDVAKAIAAIKHTLQWRKEFHVDKIVSALEDDEAKKNGINNMESNDDEEEEEDLATILRKENETGKIYVRGYDKDGRAMMYMRPGRENTMHEDNNIHHLVFQIEKAVKCSQKNGHGKICLVIDYEGFHISKTPPMSTTKRTLDILQRHFCERMYRAYICNPPFVFRSFYAVIKPFVDPVTKEKICWCVGQKGMDQVVEDVGGPAKAETQLEKCCGGGGEKLRDFDSEEYMRLPLTVAFDEKV
mmetsp:Transcript_29195/g.79011  ORF Transcript_29195/g.79011 Transcript_29195/m.79011 type:complete len:400 (-) Transcript_29195:328-1527(-)|eukprot:CAMPEP_0172367902 /NCGR_PEP_ID=MMETSP1060-20121228/24448_1 /TAXON_ID=37318 /ORGANISM="Pseudo-nitzschia pungens, Strain cf. cingulata" /LENGTH=399 /DNA_ID=CAMNT_0013092319 /DNA_START=153 /DNA_END=1352 /DNA_ORIENTATION=+